MKNNVAAVVVTYNRCALLDECIRALLISKRKTDVLVIDNASTDNTQDVVKQFLNDERVHYFNTGANLGGAGGFNYGLRKAYEMGYEYFWLMDDDTIVEPDALEELLKAAEICGGDYGFLASLVFWTDGSECKMNKQVLDARKEMDRRYMPFGMARVRASSLVSLFTQRKVVKEVGLPIKEYFIWGDDTEYTLRISRNWPCYLAAKSQVVHKMKENQSAEDSVKSNDVSRIKRLQNSYRNNICTAKRRGIKPLLKSTVTTAMGVLRLILTRGQKHKLLILGMFIKGYISGLLFHPQIEYVD